LNETGLRTQSGERLTARFARIDAATTRRDDVLLGEIVARWTSTRPVRPGLKTRTPHLS
jgi:hypothetical protein